MKKAEDNWQIIEKEKEENEKQIRVQKTWARDRNYQPTLKTK